MQTALFEHGTEQHLLRSRHPRVHTSPRSNLATNLRCYRPRSAPIGGGEARRRHHYHGPGQLVGYPILSVDNALGAAAHVQGCRALLIDALAEVGLPGVGRLASSTASGSTPRGRTRARSRAIGSAWPVAARCTASRSNVAPDLTYNARAHRAVRHRLPAGEVACRGGHRRVARTGRRCRRPARHRSWGGWRG